MDSSRTIGIDARMIQHTGIGTYLRGILNEMHTLKGPETLVRLHGDSDYQVPGFQNRLFSAPLYSIKEQLDYRAQLKGTDLWHSPHYNVPYFKGKTRLVVTIHDLIHWIFRKEFFSPLQAFYAGAMFRRAVQTADKIIAVSENTRKDLVEHFQTDPAKIRVVYEGVDPRFEQPLSEEAIRQLKVKYQLPEKFFLYIGSLKKHKNILSLIRVFRKLYQKRQTNFGLVVAGRKDRSYPESWAEVAELATGNGIWYLDSVGNQEMPALYQSASALVHPSLYEGFGLTILEAMAGGTPVIAARVSSLPEVAGDAALWFDPRDVQSLEQALQTFETSSGLPETMREKGFKQAAAFRWEKAALQTWQIYQDVLKEK